VLFDIPSQADSAAAVSSRRPGAQMFFVMPWQGRTLIGTGHALVGELDDPTKVPEKQIVEFVDAVDEAVPSLGVSRSRVARLFSGCLPAADADRLKLTNRPLIVNHAKHGFAGLYSLWGIKYTTSRALAQRVLRTAFGKEFNVPASASRPARPPSLVPSIAHAALPGEPVRAGDLNPAQIADLVRLAEQTGVQHLDDLVLRRCGLGDFPANARDLAAIVAAQLPWTAERRRAEIQRFAGIE
jgi:glycerol-3-phosphate dehydrogenase